MLPDSCDWAYGGRHTAFFCETTGQWEEKTEIKNCAGQLLPACGTNSVAFNSASIFEPLQNVMVV